MRGLPWHWNARLAGHPWPTRERAPRWLHARDAFVLLLPLFGAFIARWPVHYPPPVGFWQGLVLQCVLLPTLFIIQFAHPGWRALGFTTRGMVQSLLLGALYCLIYILLLLVSSRYGLHTPHFDEARRFLGTPLVLALYFPFWGLLESVWMAYAIAAFHGWLSPRGDQVRWRDVIAAGVWFGILHALVQVILYRAPFLPSLSYVLVGVLMVVAGSIRKATRNAWGMVLFWCVTNF
ncbi:hypothetical protein GCM10010885_11050 [Alicyclobacillus cellulosilyticus]|uniref:Uncharacterized protein n=1 Tax=Alicyclobacillus cellulosilyticus TaxID=1003997 RepID=A0A917K875_9BACL|nr:hypothetical protein [Alicyclobacillus cellulosilyticus]GGJ03539.1 hypothetical protein GCM10010885_11050 [Alicyclobacillus cellulosilyticus]